MVKCRPAGGARPRDCLGQAGGLFGERRMTADACLMFLGRIRRHVEQLAEHPGSHGFRVQGCLPVIELLDVTAPAGIRLECGFLRAETGGYRTLRRDRARPMALKKGFDRVLPGAGRGRRRGFFAARGQQAA